MNDSGVRVWGETHRGQVRPENQDRFLIRKIRQGHILAVADGVGGNGGGAVAARAVISAVRDFDFSGTDLERELRLALGKGEKKIREKSAGQPDLAGMGTTLTLAAVTEGPIRWIHVGDTRLYRLSGGKLTQVTTDHTFIQDLIDDGVLSPEQAGKHPLRNVLERCVGMDGTRPDSGRFHAGEDDGFLLCSDGLTRHLSNREIASCLEKGLAAGSGAKALVRELMAAALAGGGEDNITVVLYLAG
ncbi:MAG: protein phosphatase 2C domain-containing protein [Desulfobacterales bacterium]|nr:protein phosphatase 2C domain-containing protein [Desulfobacterales bacterium]